MPNIVVSNPVDAEGKPIDLSAVRSGNNKGFELIPAGFYDAVVEKLVEKKGQRWGWGQIKSAAKDGKWDVELITPQIRLLNDNKTFFNRDDVTVYYKDEKGNPVRAAADGKPALMDEALNLFRALGLAKESGDKQWTFAFEYENITDRVIRVRVAHQGYVKATKKNIKPKELTQLFTDVSGGSYTFEDYPGLIEKYNAQNEFDATSGLRVSNVVTGFYGLNEDQANAGAWYYDTHSKAVYLSEASFHQYENNKTSKNGATPW